ncbi:hypothetical protein EUX98_g9295 [Antrodiella citrinella]|uniref:non-specific serine/threonine protein kinase n=1 Tax=Antrodiella citrinella TaxID=2447956 RepID=A0A4S4LWF1_9APHY|nr:hypothetical protein EUX98_g9295 [Antrodiella citrinella]
MSTLPSEFGRIGGKYRAKEQIGTGTVYLGQNILNKSDVAIKVEPCDTDHPQLAYERSLYRILGSGPGIPNIFWYGSDQGYNFMVMDALGSSLEVLFDACGSQFTLKTVLLLADQLITRLEYIHSHDLVHGDIKPANILMGIGRRADIAYIVDYGLTKRYIRDGMHIKYKVTDGFMGTARFASLNIHSGIQSTRRDDLESLAYVLIYFLRGSLPWENIAETTKEEELALLTCKTETSIQDLCAGLPNEFSEFLSYARGLQYSECPDYIYIHHLFSTLRIQLGHMQRVFDWTIPDATPHMHDEQPHYVVVSKPRTCKPFSMQQVYATVFHIRKTIELIVVCSF